MKPKLLLGLVLVLSGSLFSCSTTTSHSPGIVVEESKPLYTRKYPINGNVFLSNLDRQTNWKKETASESKPPFASVNVMPIIQDAFSKVLADAGVNLQPPSAFFINDRLGYVLFRGTLQECDVVNRVVADLNRGPVTNAKTSEP